VSGWRVERDPWFGCELWRGSVNSAGYPTHWGGGRPRQAYLVALERAGVAIPEGHEADHLCRRPLCVAPAHFEVVPRRVNQQRKFWKNRSQIAACSKGHDLKIHGRRTPEGGTVCRICSGTWKPDGEPMEVLE
jgi:hypothetical protein